MSSTPSDVFSIDHNYPTTNFLLVPGPSPQFYTVYIFKYSDWVAGRVTPNHAVAQTAINSNGTWKGILDPVTSTFSAITLPETEVDGTAIGPYTVVAIRRVFIVRTQPLNDTIVLALQISAPATTPYILPVPLGGTGTATPSLIAGTNVTITGAWPDQTINASSGSSGGIFVPVPRTSAYSANAFDMVLCDTSGGSFIVTLPTSSGNTGKSIMVKKVSSDTNTVIVATTGGDTIDTVSTKTIAFQFSNMQVTADGVSNWDIT